MTIGQIPLDIPFPYVSQHELIVFTIFPSFPPNPFMLIYSLFSHLWMSFLSQKLWNHFWFFSFKSFIQSPSPVMFSRISLKSIYSSLFLHLTNSLYLRRAAICIYGYYELNCIPLNNILKFQPLVPQNVFLYESHCRCRLRWGHIWIKWALNLISLLSLCMKA